ncbi:MAG: cytochrome c biogenesis heme-transporting ATPase CcmA [Rubrivivax sp.]|nr:MAG: cytochrome c biogenesis heme-transporting ATPase CcmA [Rubrivivax sp.]
MLEADELSHARGDRTLFTHVSFTLRAGEALWVSGPNGSGKTSLLRLLCGLGEPIEGEVRWKGVPIGGLGEDYRRHLLYLGHAPGVKDDLLAWENVRLGMQIHGGACSREQAHDALARIGLPGIAHLPTRVLSQGQRKRVALARLLVQPPRSLLVLDEPFTALDHESVDVLQSALGEHLDGGGLVVYTTHQDLALGARRLHRLDLAEALAC